MGSRRARRAWPRGRDGRPRRSTVIRARPGLAGRGDGADVAAGRHRSFAAARTDAVAGPGGDAGGPRIVLSGHLDVVPPGDPATWTADPWGGEIRDGALYGRGACDMKGGVAAILAAVRALGAAGDLDRLAGELIVALVPSEEDGGQGTLAAIRAGVRGDLAIITEPSNLDVVVAHAGAITFRLTVPGRAAHASQRREGVSALDKLFVLSTALEADEARRNAAETDPLMTALGLPVPDDHRHRVGRRVGVDRARPGHRRRAVRRPARPDGGRRRGRAPRLHRSRLRRRRVPARPPGDRRDHRRPVRVRARPVGPPAAGRPGRRGRGASPAGGRRCSASRTAPTCGCSSTSRTRRASSSARATSRSPTAPTSTSRSTRSRPARAVLRDVAAARARARRRRQPPAAVTARRRLTQQPGRHDDQRRAEQPERRVARRRDDDARSEAGGRRRAPDQRVGQALDPGPLGETEAAGEQGRTRHEAEVPAVPEQEQGEEQDDAAVHRGGGGEDGRELGDDETGQDRPGRSRTGRSGGPRSGDSANIPNVWRADDESRRRPARGRCSVMCSGVIVMIRVMTTWTVTSETIAIGTFGCARILPSDVAVPAFPLRSPSDLSASWYGSGRSITSDRTAALPTNTIGRR